MEREVFVSAGGGISVFSADGKKTRAAALEGAGALCVSGGNVYCAGDDGRVIYRLDRQSLMTRALFAGGPGICDLILSSDGMRLYALCADADSVLMLDARSGRPMIVSPAGCNPRRMALCGDVLAVAGGESGCVHLLDAHSLYERGRIHLPGPVCDLTIGDEAVQALCLTQWLDSVLVTVHDGGREEIALRGLPGCLMRGEHALLCAAHGRLYAVSQEGEISSRPLPGRVCRLLGISGRLFALDEFTGQLFACRESGRGWRLLCTEARDAAVG